MFDLFKNLADRARTLDTVARWLVRDLERSGMRSATELTDAAFAVLHPELGGRPIERGEAALIADYQRIERDIVDPVLAGAAPGGAKIPPGYKLAGNKRGLKRYSTERLDTKLRALRALGRVAITDDEIDTFQRIANVETGGTTQALNTWDSAVVSIGFFQLTLQHGKLQALIRKAPAAFARYGIEVDPVRTYAFDDPQPAIKGALDREDLRWNGWADRFYQAGLDDDVLVAQVIDGRARLANGIDVAAKRYLKAMPGAYELFKRAYDGSLPLRGLYQEALNNKPTAARDGLPLVMKRVLAEGATSPARIYAIAKQAIYDTFVAKNDRSSGESVTRKTATL